MNIDLLSPHQASKPRIRVRELTPQVNNAQGSNSARTIVNESGQRVSKADLLSKSNIVTPTNSQLEISQSQDDGTPIVNANGDQYQLPSSGLPTPKSSQKLQLFNILTNHLRSTIEQQQNLLQSLQTALISPRMPKEQDNDTDYTSYSTNDLRDILLEKDSKILSCLEMVKQMELSEHIDLEKFKALEAKLRKYKETNAQLTDKNAKLHQKVHAMEAEVGKLSKLLEFSLLDYNSVKQQNQETEAQLDQAIAQIEDQRHRIEEFTTSKGLLGAVKSQIEVDKMFKNQIHALVQYQNSYTVKQLETEKQKIEKSLEDLQQLNAGLSEENQKFKSNYASKLADLIEKSEKITKKDLRLDMIKFNIGVMVAFLTSLYLLFSIIMNNR